MPGLSGLELQQRLNEQRSEIPIIFITGHGDVPMAVTAMKSGAADFIQKPFRDQDLIDRINKALGRDRERRKGRAEEDAIRQRIALLTPREKEVMQRVVRGHANKVIAMDLGVSQRTVELHRARVMKKLRMRSVAELVHAVDRIGGVAAAEAMAARPDTALSK
jgi:FixJ family two-component response regulator